MSNKALQQPQGTEQEFLRIFNSLLGRKQAWQVWDDIMTAMACSISNALEPDQKRRMAREKEYEKAVQGYDFDVLGELFGIVVLAMDRKPDQDFLGAMYMNLNLGSHWTGQFFTPYSVCRMMAQTTIDKDLVEKQIEKKGWISVSDPSCGAGATLVSAANELLNLGVNYQTQCLFVGQDIDRVVAKMCYIQLSLLGCAGYIAVANTLTDPITGDTLQPYEKGGQEFWYTPMYWSDLWTGRRIARMMDLQTRRAQKLEEQKKHTFVFIYDEEGETA